MLFTPAWNSEIRINAKARRARRRKGIDRAFGDHPSAESRSTEIDPIREPLVFLRAFASFAVVDDGCEKNQRSQKIGRRLGFSFVFQLPGLSPLPQLPPVRFFPPVKPNGRLKIFNRRERRKQRAFVTDHFARGPPSSSTVPLCCTRCIRATDSAQVSLRLGVGRRFLRERLIQDRSGPGASPWQSWQSADRASQMASE